MAEKRGRGAPKGNVNRTDGMRVRAALDAALKLVEKDLLSKGAIRKALDNPCKGDGQQALIAMWASCVRAAAFDGDLAAMDRVMDRLAGKPRQQVDHGNAEGEDGEPTVLRMVVVRPGDKVD